MLTGFDLDLARSITQVTNRMHGLFTQIHPALERVLGPRLDHEAVLQVLATWPTPALLRKAGLNRIDGKLKKYGARRHLAWAQEVMDALDQQTVVVIGTDAAGLVIPHLTHQLIALHAQRRVVAERVEEIVLNHPLYPVPISLPGVAIRTASVILADLSGKTFESAAALASYAGLAPPQDNQEARSTPNESATPAINASNQPCSSQLSPRYDLTPPAGPTMTENANKANATTKPSSPSPTGI